MIAFDPPAVTVFCGSRPGARPEYAAAARELGGCLVRHGLGLVYGGGNVGLMGVVADAVLAAGGPVTGVIEALAERELAHHGVSELLVVDTMHTRKRLMAERAGAFVALPGGMGTFEELFEVLTWAQLGIHHQPVGALDVAGYFAPLAALLAGAVDQGFLRPEHSALLTIDDDPERLLARLSAARRTATPPEPLVEP